MKKLLHVDWPKLVAAVLAVEIVGNIGVLATLDNISGWYAGLVKPAFTPPGWIFGAVWLTLYGLMGAALYVVWAHGANRRAVRRAIVAFCLQLVLNVAWTFIFFAWHQPLVALLDIIVLWLTALVSTGWFCRVSRIAGWLMVPSVLWVAFAALLNVAIWALN